MKNNEVSSGVVKDGSLELLIKGILEDSSSTSPKQWEYWEERQPHSVAASCLASR